MKSHWKRDLLIGIGATVFGGLLLNYLVGISPRMILAFIGDIFIWIFKTATLSISIHLWLLILLSFGSMVALFIMLAPFFQKAKTPTFRDCREGTFEGVLWRWHYNFDGSVSDTWCFCPACDTALVYSAPGDDYSRGYRRTTTRFFCELCNTDKLTIEGDRHYLVQKVIRQIERIVRTAEWKKRLPPET